MKTKIWLVPMLVVTLSIIAIGVEKSASSKIVSSVERALPKAKGVSASMPLLDMPGNVTSNFIKSVSIIIEKYRLSGSATDVSLSISASQISKVEPTVVRSLDLTATIPESAITSSSLFDGAQIVGNALQISVGSGGLGQALLIPKFSDNQLYFELQSVSLFGNEIPTSTLPSDIQEQIKSKSTRNLSFPKGFKFVSVSLNSEGLSLSLHGENVKVGNLGSTL